MRGRSFMREVAPEARMTAIAWADVKKSLWANGFSRLGPLLSRQECRSLRELYGDDEHFRSRIDMARYRFGQGEYKYFRYPLPKTIAKLRSELYPPLRTIANPWMAAIGLESDFPPRLEPFLANCAARGQTRPTPLLLRYRDGDYNCLHQDVYGELVFPFQVIFALSDPERYEGGELLLVEQHPRAQSRGHALKLAQGEAVVISTRFRPVRGSRGFYRAAMRHGVSTITRGERLTLGIIFHDAK